MKFDLVIADPPSFYILTGSNCNRRKSLCAIILSSSQCVMSRWPDIVLFLFISYWQWDIWINRLKSIIAQNRTGTWLHMSTWRSCRPFYRNKISQGLVDYSEIEHSARFETCHDSRLRVTYARLTPAIFIETFHELSLRVAPTRAS